MTHNKTYRLNEFAKLIGVSTKTLQRWDKEGKLIACRSQTNRRYYTHAQLLECMKKYKVIYSRNPMIPDNTTRNEVTDNLEEYCKENSIAFAYCIEDYANSKEGWDKLLQLVISDNIDEIIVSSNDIYVSFGYEWFKELCKWHGCSIRQVKI